MPFFEPLKGGTPPLDATLAELNGALGGALSDLLLSQQFTGALGSSATAVLPPTAPFGKCAAIGLGRPTAFRSLGAMHVAWGELIARYTPNSNPNPTPNPNPDPNPSPNPNPSLV